MNTIPPVLRGFTLIELMISIMLGSMVVYIAVAGLRTAAQSVTLGQQMAVENAIIRAGMMVALQETDFWTNHDDPLDSSGGTPGPRQGLRQVSSAGGRFQGLPFTPFKSNPLYSDDNVPRMTAGQMDAGTLETTPGWDANAWSAHESRGWTWANLAERVPVVQLPSTKAGVPVKDSNGKQVYYATNNFKSGDSNRAIVKRQLFGAYHLVAAPKMSTTPVTPALTLPHNWQQQQLDGLKRSLGSYGLFEYLPANAGLAIYSTQHNAGLWAVSPEWCFVNGGKDGSYLGTDSRSEGVNFSQDIMLATLGTVYAPPNPLKKLTSSASAEQARTVADLRDISNRRYGTGISLDVNSNDDSIGSIEKMLNEVEIRRPWLDAASAPATWPSLDVSTLRHIRSGASVCLNRISWVHPLTGRQTEFTFTAFGTNLRGARQQRLRDAPGWCDPFPESGTVQANLDSYQP